MPCNHPESNTVPCMECGKNFCTICYPPKGAGQSCPACYEKLLSGLVEKTTKPSVKERVRHKAESTKEKAGGIKKKAGDTVVAVKGSPRTSASFFHRKTKETRGYFNGRFPITLTEKQRMEEIPPLRETWYKFLILTLGGAVILIALAWLTHQRNPLSSLFVAVLVAVAVVWTFGWKNDIRVAVVALTLALAALLIGEVGLLLLFRISVIKKLDLMPVSVYSLNRSGAYYGQFMFKVIVWRLLPEAVLAFLIGLWPLPKRFSWKGFAKKEAAEPEPPLNSEQAVGNQG